MTHTPQQYTTTARVDAVQWDGTAEAATPIIDWVRSRDGAAHFYCHHDMGCIAGSVRGHTIGLHTADGRVQVEPGDWIIRGATGHFFRWPAAYFADHYQPVNATGWTETFETGFGEVTIAHGEPVSSSLPEFPDRTDPRLTAALTDLGREWGPLGVALAAARLTDPNVLISYLSRNYTVAVKPEPAEPAPEPPRSIRWDGGLTTAINVISLVAAATDYHAAHIADGWGHRMRLTSEDTGEFIAITGSDPVGTPDLIRMNPGDTFTLSGDGGFVIERASDSNAASSDGVAPVLQDGSDESAAILEQMRLANVIAALAVTAEGPLNLVDGGELSEAAAYVRARVDAIVNPPSTSEGDDVKAGA